MPQLGPTNASSASGWTNSNNIFALDSVYATASCSTINNAGTEFIAQNNPSPSLISAGYAFSLSAGTQVNGFQCSINLYSSPNNAGASGVIYLARAGVLVGATKAVTITAGANTVTLGGSTDLWGGSWAAADVANLQVIFYANATSNVTSSSSLFVDNINVTCFYQAGSPAAFSFTPVTAGFVNTQYAAVATTISGLGAGVLVTAMCTGDGFTANAPGDKVGYPIQSSYLVGDGYKLTVYRTSSPSFSTTVGSTLTIGSTSATFNVTTAAANTTPNPFSFGSLFNVSLNTFYSPSAFNVSGINAPSPISIVNGDYSLDNGAFTSASGNVSNGQSVLIRQSTAGTYSTTKTTTLTIGGVNGTFNTTTLAASSSTPNAFSFASATNVNPSTVQTSAAINITGTTIAAAISVSNGSYSINGGAFVTTAGSINPTDTVQARNTASAAYSTNNVTTVTIGGVAGTFTSTTRAPNLNPTQFTFTDVTGAAVSTVFTSNTVTMAALEGVATVTLALSGGTSHQLNINGAGFVAYTVPVSISNGQTLAVRMTSPSSISQTGNITVTIGTVADTYSVTTAAVVAPSAITFASVPNAQPGTTVTSAGVTLAGGMTTAQATTTNCTFDIGGDNTFSNSRAVANGNVIRLRVVAPLQAGVTIQGTISISGVTGSFSVSSRGGFTFTDF